MTQDTRAWVEKTHALDPAVYDRYRPVYPAEVFAAIQNYQPIHAGTHCLEIGIGTGQATEPFLRAGATVTALEPAAKMASYTRAKYATTPGLTVIETPFEDMHTRVSFDLVYAATSFHWVKAANRMEMLRSLLAPGGAVALFWNHPAPLDPVHAALQPVYARFMPGESLRNKQPWVEADADEIAAELRVGGFHDVVTRIIRSERYLTTSEYIGLLHTYSDHISQPDSVRIPFMRAIATVIDAHGGSITIANTVDLHLARL